MATYFVSPTGSGSGASTSSPMSLDAALNAASQAGDIVNIMPGYYAHTLNPKFAGSSLTNRITFQAQDPNNKPVFTGAWGAVSGASAPSPINSGWVQTGTNFQSTGVLNYGNGNSGTGKPYVWRHTGFSSNVGGVFVNHPSDGASPLGYYSFLWMTCHQNADWGHASGGGSNPDLRIHEATQHSLGTSAADYYKSLNVGDTHYLCHDWQAQARWNGNEAKLNYNGFPTDSLDIRLHSSTATPNTGSGSSVNVYPSGAGKCFDFSKSYITFKNLIFRHWYGGQITTCTGFTMDGCWMDCMYDYGLNITDNCPNVTLKNCRLLGAGPREFGADCVAFGLNCNNCLVDGCEIAYGGHGGLLALYTLSGLTVQNCTFHHCGTALSIQSVGGTQISTNITIQNNTFHDTGFMADRAPEITIRITPHAAIELDSVDGGMIRRNLFYNVCQGILLKGYQSSSHTVKNINVQHNTVASSQMGSFVIEGDGTGGTLLNNIRNNIFVGPNVGDTFFRSSYGSLGNAPTVHLPYEQATFQTSNQFRTNLYYEGAANGITPRASHGVLGDWASILGSGGAAASNATVWGPTSFAGISGDVNPNFTGGNTFALASNSPAINAGQALNGETGNDLGYLEFGGGGVTNLPPTAALTANGSSATLSVNTGATVTFNANGTDQTNSDGTFTDPASLQYLWTFGDGTADITGTGHTSFDQELHTYNAIGTFTCKVTITDGGGLTGSDSVVINVGTGASGTPIAPSSMLVVNSFGTNGVDQTNQGPEKLIDGFWAINGGVAAQNNWARTGLTLPTPGAVQGVIIDLQRTVNLTRLTVSHYPGGGNSRNYNYTLATSVTNTSGSYTDIGTASTALSPDFSEIPFAQRTGVRYLKLTVNSASDGSNTASFWEMVPYEATVTNNPPTLNLTSNVTSGPANLTVNFNSGAADDGGTGTLTYAWVFGDGATAATGITQSHVYTVVGNYTASITVTDAGGLTASQSLPITVTAAPVNNAPNVTLTSNPAPATITVGQSVIFTVSASDPEGSPLTYAWTFGDGGTATGVGPQTHAYSSTGVLTATVAVSDNGTPTGVVKTTSKSVTVTINAGGSNSWPMVDTWDNYGTPINALFGPGKTLNKKIVTDGDPSSRWIAPIISGLTLIGWDLSQNRVIKRFRGYFDHSINGRRYNVTLQYSTDKNNWTNFTGMAGVATVANTYYTEWVFGTSVNARYVRVIFNGSDNACAGIWSVDISDN